jgi:hypothetical protein
MKLLHVCALFGVLMHPLVMLQAMADTGQVTIDRIDADVLISGSVKGVKPASDYKVLVYVHTDKWYIHPWADRGEGQSWAAIKDDGSWKIATVQRQYKADKVAALVVKRSYAEPPTLSSFEGVPYEAITIKTLTGTPDHGKL